MSAYKPSDKHAYQALADVLYAGHHATKKEAAPDACKLYHERTGGIATEVALLRMARRYARWQHTAPRVAVSVPTHEYGTQPQAANSIAQYTAPLHIDAERVIVVGDIHIPTTDWNFAARVSQLARWHDVKTLCIIGDLFNFDALSEYASIVPGISLTQEISAAQALIAEWLSVFDRIYMTTGNHETRLMRKTHAALGFSELAGMITQDARFTLSPYAYMRITSEGEAFHATHQRNYSKIKLRVADGLAALHGMNIITHHEHHAAIGMDSSGRYAIVSNGGLHSAASMAYVQLSDSTMPRMTQSFVYIEEGTAHLLTPYDVLTDWRKWIPPRDEKVVNFREDKTA